MFFGKHFSSFGAASLMTMSAIFSTIVLGLLAGFFIIVVVSIRRDDNPWTRLTKSYGCTRKSLTGVSLHASSVYLRCDGEKVYFQNTMALVGANNDTFFISYFLPFSLFLQPICLPFCSLIEHGRSRVMFFSKCVSFKVEGLEGMLLFIPEKDSHLILESK